MATPTPTPVLGNAQTDIISGFGDMGGLIPVSIIVISLVLLFFGAIQSARVYRWLLDASSTFATSLEYAIKGVATAAVITFLGAPLYLYTTLDAGTQTLIWQAIGALIGGYIGLVALGYIGEQVWRAIVSQHEQATGHKPFEHWGEDEELADADP